MPSVVIIHAADDALPARALGEKLRGANLTPVIEQAPGQARQDAVRNAALAIALWSPRSTADEDVNADAAAARASGKLVHACMQSVQPPAEFRGEQWVDLTGWRGEDEFAPWRELAMLITSAAGVAPLPPPEPRPPSGFFQPGRTDGATAASPSRPQPAPIQPAPRPQPTAATAPPPRTEPPRNEPPRRAEPPPARGVIDPPREKSGGPNMALIGIVTFLIVAGAGAGGYYFWSQSQGGAAAAAWEDLDRSSPAELRAFLEGNPGALRDEARAALSELEQTRYAEARATDTIEALEAFVADFPQSSNVLAARGRIAELRSAPAAAAEEPPGEALSPEALNPGGQADPDLVPPGSLSPPPPTNAPVSLTPAPAAEPDPEPEPAQPPEPGDPTD